MRLVIFLFLFLSFNAFAYDIEAFQSGTFISVVIEIENGKIHAMPAGSAYYADGSRVDNAVSQWGGHGEIADLNHLDVEKGNLLAGGILIDDERYIIKLKSISVNSYNPDVDSLNSFVPQKDRAWFAQQLSNYIQKEVTLNGELFKPNRQISRCTSIFFSMEKLKIIL